MSVTVNRIKALRKSNEGGSLVDRLAEGLRGHIVGLMRIIVGLLWLANLEWKRPLDFGQDKGNGLYKYVDSAVRRPVFGPFSWFIENVVVKQYRLFGWVTLVVEIALAVCLLLGFHTRLAALIGAVMSINILLSVLNYDKATEWPWSYYLMFAIHLLIFAVGAGRMSIDGLRSGDGANRTHGVQALGAIAVVVGVIGVIAARAGDFASTHGEVIGYAQGNWELKLLRLNVLSAILTIAVGLIAVVGARVGKSMLAWVSVLALSLMSLQVLLQWRASDGPDGFTGGVLGGTGATLAFWLLLAVGMVACMRPSRGAAVA
jgi:thiosulfate dehydrogenase (quinone) large subunit